MSLTLAPSRETSYAGTWLGRFVRRGSWLLLGSLVQAALLGLTARPPVSPGLGAPTWHHNASLLLAVVAVGIWWVVAARRGQALWRDRAHLGIWVLVWTVLATVSGFLLLYLKQDLKAWELKDWAKWWHVLWSWLALGYFVAHTAANWEGMKRAWTRIHARLGPALRHDLALVAVVAAIPLTWSSWGATVWTEASYIPWTLWTVLGVVAPLYAAWAYVRLMARRTRQKGVGPIGVTSTLPGWSRRAVVRSQTDAWLFASAVLANLSGFPLLYFGTKDTSLKYVAKYWHTWPSVVFAALVFAHAIQFWAAMRVHWRSDPAA